MTAPDSLPLHALAEENLAAASPDLLRAMIKTFAKRSAVAHVAPGPPPRLGQEPLQLPITRKRWDLNPPPRVLS
ncbi:hypothetical protein GCM10009601_60670 [Streptomyces thermospinosisporus]|uniref:Uncharacterized protein n=2 Tax=Streptomyces TaxID=1883 RepID=A0ABN1Z9Z1_9ACTN